MAVQIDHPFVQHKLALIRDAETGHKRFRELAKEITQFICYEALKNIRTKEVVIETPLAPATCRTIDTDLVVIPILRAGVGMLDGILDLLPTARVGFVGLYRDEKTLQPVQYYFKVPEALEDRLVIAVDPMLATGNSSAAAVDLLKKSGAIYIRFLCLLAAPEGIARMNEAHPDVPILTAAVDEKLNDKGYIVPGLGDAGDRMFGTK